MEGQAQDHEGNEAGSNVFGYYLVRQQRFRGEVEVEGVADEANALAPDRAVSHDADATYLKFANPEVP
jgi:hypothetical protein